LILTNPQPAEYRDQFVVKWGHHIREVWDSNPKMFMLDASLNLWSLQSCALKNVFHENRDFAFPVTLPHHSNAKNSQSTTSRSELYHTVCFRICKDGWGRNM